MGRNPDFFTDESGAVRPIRGTAGYDPIEEAENRYHQRSRARRERERRRKSALARRLNPGGMVMVAHPHRRHRRHAALSLRRLFRPRRHNPMLASGGSLGGPLVAAAVVVALALFGPAIASLIQAGSSGVSLLPASKADLARSLLANNPQVSLAYQQAGWSLNDPIAIMDDFIRNAPQLASYGRTLDGFVRWEQATRWGAQQV